MVSGGSPKEAEVGPSVRRDRPSTENYLDSNIGKIIFDEFSLAYSFSSFSSVFIPGYSVG